MGQLEESSELTLDFTKLEKVGAQVAASRAAAVEHDPGVIPVAVQNADTKEVILVAYTNEFAMKESFLWSTSRNKLWFKGETSGETFDLLEAYVNCEQNSLLYIVRPCRGGICHTKDKAGAPRNCYYRKIDFDTLGHRLLLSLDSHRRHKGLDERHRKVRFDLPEGNAKEGPCGQGGFG